MWRLQKCIISPCKLPRYLQCQAALFALVFVIHRYSCDHVNNSLLSTYSGRVVQFRNTQVEFIYFESCSRIVKTAVCAISMMQVVTYLQLGGILIALVSRLNWIEDQTCIYQSRRASNDMFLEGKRRIVLPQSSQHWSILPKQQLPPRKGLSNYVSY